MKLWMAALLAARSVMAVSAPKPAHAEIRDRVIGIDAGLDLLFGDLGKAYGTMVGGIVRYEQKLQPAMSFTARLGYLRALDKEKDIGLGQTMTVGMDVVTLRGGIVYRLQPSTDGLFLSGELALNYETLRQNGETKGDAKSLIGGAAGVGYRSGIFSVRGALDYLDLSDTSQSMTGMLTVGWDFKGLD